MRFRCSCIEKIVSILIVIFVASCAARKPFLESGDPLCKQVNFGEKVVAHIKAEKIMYVNGNLEWSSVTIGKVFLHPPRNLDLDFDLRMLESLSISPAYIRGEKLIAEEQVSALIQCKELPLRLGLTGCEVLLPSRNLTVRVVLKAEMSDRWSSIARGLAEYVDSEVLDCNP